MSRRRGKKVKPPSRVIVIGGSEGAIEALLEIVRSLPPDFGAAIFVVVHVPSDADSYLPQILSRSGPLPAKRGEDGESVRPGVILVAPPDHHLTIRGNLVRVHRGPRENRHRPAIDPLFRTAARSFRSAVIGVLLSGNLDDGSAGLLAVRNAGGIGMVQDPSRALVGEMPRRGLEYAGADFILSADEIGAKLIELTSRDVAMKKPRKRGRTVAKSEVREHEHDIYGDEHTGKPSVFACPECHGVLWEIEDGRILRYRCRVGHAYGARSLKGELDQSAERAMWAAMRALEEKAAMEKRLIQSSKVPKGLVDRLREQSEADAANADIIRKMILNQH